MLYTFTKKRNYIGRLHFDTFGCLTPHTTDRACFFLFFSTGGAAKKGPQVGLIDRATKPRFKTEIIENQKCDRCTNRSTEVWKD